jgi:hypothetical protein
VSSSNRRKASAVALAVVGLAGLSLASAATLNLSGSTLAANTATVASCQPAATPITVGFTSAFSTAAYKVSAVQLKSVDAACATKAVRVTLLGASDAVLGEVTGTVAAGTTTLASVPAGVSASAVEKVAVVISD